MGLKKKKPLGKRDADWAKAKQLCRLNMEDVRMAKEMGLNPRKLVKNIPSKSQPWKAPVKHWIRDLYSKMQEKAAATKARKLKASVADLQSPPQDAAATGETAAEGP
jgi:hypothetical protein